MDMHPVFVDFLTSWVLFILFILFNNYLCNKKKTDANFSASMCYSLYWLATFFCAKWFHVSMALIPINGGAPWNKSGWFLTAFWLGVIATIYFYVKSRKKQPPVLDKPDAP